MVNCIDNRKNTGCLFFCHVDSSLALTATMTVERDITTAPAAGGSKKW
jgi:hypothetical protein